MKHTIGNRVIPKQYCKILIFYKFLSNKTDIFRELLPNTTDFFHRRCIRQYSFLFHTFYIETGISATFRKDFDFKKLKIVLYTVGIFIFCYYYKHLLFSNKPYQPEWNLTRPFNIMPRTVACNRIT